MLRFIKVKVTVGSSKESVEVEKENTLRIAVNERAEENRANDRVVELVARHFSVAPKAVRIVSGHHQRSKMLRIAGN